MGALIDLTDQAFGRWTVIERAGADKYGRVLWLCKCECGNEGVVPGRYLLNGKSKSCGCFRRSWRKLPDGQAAANSLLSTYKRSATERGYSFDLTQEEFLTLTSQNCYYCGVEPSAVHNPNRHSTPYIYNGIDRVDNDKGYTSDNVVSCCKECNFSKRARNVEEFMEWGKRLGRFQLEDERKIITVTVRNERVIDITGLPLAWDYQVVDLD